MVKMKINKIFFVNAEFHRVVWTINALLTVRSELLQISGNNQNIKMFGASPPEHFATGYVHNDNLPLGNIALQYIIPNKLEGLMVFSDDFLHFLKIKEKFVKFTRTILWL